MLSVGPYSPRRVFPSSMLGNSNANEAREGYRQFLHSTIQPGSQIILVSYGISSIPPTWRFRSTNLMAADIASRARAFGVMVTGGMSLERGGWYIWPSGY